MVIRVDTLYVGTFRFTGLVRDTKKESRSPSVTVVNLKSTDTSQFSPKTGTIRILKVGNLYRKITTT